MGEQSIWDVGADGANPQRLFAGSQSASDACCGRWTPDGKFFVFQAQGQIWALPKEGRLFHGANQPIQLTSSPMSLQSPIPSKDGTKLFVVGRTYRGEQTEYNGKTGQPSPFFGGISADWIEASRDGKQIAYVSYPQGDLWKSNMDGTGRVQLTFAPVHPVLPRWSPDGTTIAFFEFPEGSDHPGKSFGISADGGTPRELMPGVKGNQQDPGWSADGKKIVFRGDANDAMDATGPAVMIYDLQTHEVSGVPASKGLFSPRWSPDGRYIVAMTADSKQRDAVRLPIAAVDEDWKRNLELAELVAGWAVRLSEGLHRQGLGAENPGGGPQGRSRRRSEGYCSRWNWRRISIDCAG